MTDVAMALAPFAGIAAGIAALLYLGSRAWQIAKIIDALHGLVEDELRPNGGGSLHDKITRTDSRLTDHLADAEQDRIRLAAVERAIGL